MQMMRKSIAIMLIFAMLMVGALPIGVEAATKRFAKITELSGTVSVQKNGAEKSFKAFKGMSLAEGDSIETGVGSSATLEVDADRTVKIGDNTKVDLTELKGSVNKTKTSVKLWGGKVYVEVNKKLGNDERFDISTPTAVMGVRGTKFYVAYEKNKIRVGVVEGKVEAKVYTFEAKPGQEPTLSTVETMVLPSQEALIPEDAVDQKDVEMKEVELKDLDLFILKEIMKNPEGLSPETLKEIEDEMKRKEAEEAKRIAEQLEALKKLEIQQNNQPPVYENPTEVPQPSQNDTSSGGRNDDRDSSSNSGTSLSSVSISGTVAIGQILTAVMTPENATVSYQWMRSNSQYGTYENISGATGNSYTLTQTDLGMFLKVVVSGVGTYSGTVMSQPTNVVQGPLVITMDRLVPSVDTISTRSLSESISVQVSPIDATVTAVIADSAIVDFASLGAPVIAEGVYRAIPLRTVSAGTTTITLTATAPNMQPVSMVYTYTADPVVGGIMQIRDAASAVDLYTWIYNNSYGLSIIKPSAWGDVKDPYYYAKSLNQNKLLSESDIQEYVLNQGTALVQLFNQPGLTKTPVANGAFEFELPPSDTAIVVAGTLEVPYTYTWEYMGQGNQASFPVLDSSPGTPLSGVLTTKENLLGGEASVVRVTISKGGVVVGSFPVELYYMSGTLLFRLPTAP